MDNLRTLFRYNARVLLANSYWLLIIPVVASQLVIFWHMAIASLVTPATVARTCELVIPLLGAFLAAHALAPEQRYRVDEITFARPVPFTRTIILRLLALYSLLVILAVLMMYVYRAGLKIDVELGDVLLAGVPVGALPVHAQPGIRGRLAQPGPWHRRRALVLDRGCLEGQRVEPADESVRVRDLAAA